MKAVVQRVSEASVVVDGEVVGQIGPGLAVLLGVAHGDTEADARWMADKLVGLRVLEDDAGKMNRSLVDTAGEMLLVSQFTLLGDCRKGKRPSFVGAAPPDAAEPLYERVVALVEGQGVRVATGRFRTEMRVHLVNEGPVTLLVESPTR
ncbi:D-aminoacyl-tRNA deacylase [Botrimarina sp.]|uniref:D-aminoacyl-tRNA deacylase n=1 Tax=Botrimarina sp. TaxID=2795802 RepID=UPI0032EE2F99